MGQRLLLAAAACGLLAAATAGSDAASANDYPT